MLGKLFKKAFKKRENKNPKDITAREVREHRELKKNVKNSDMSEVNSTNETQDVQVGALASNNAKSVIVIPDKIPALDEIQKTKDIIKNPIIKTKKEKKKNKINDIPSLKIFLSDELKSMKESIDKKIDTINDNNTKIMQNNISANKDILEVNKDALDVQKESLEEQKEAEYRSEHRYKETLKSKAKDMVSKGTSMIKTGAGIVKDKVKGDSGILGMIGKLLGGAYLLKTFWPLIEEKIWPFIKDKIFPFIKEHLKETIMGLGLAKLLLDPIGSLKLAIKGFSKIVGTLGGIAMKLGKFAAKGLFNLVKGITKLAMDGVSTLASKAGELAKQGINKVKDMAVTGLSKVKDMAVTGLSAATEKVKGMALNVGEKFGTFTKNISAKMSGMGKKMETIGNKVKDIGSKLVEKGIGGAMKMGKGVGGVLKVLKPLAKIIPFLGIIVTVWDLLETFFPDFMTEVKSMFSIKKMKEIGSEIWASIKSAVSGIGDWISEKISDVVQGYAKLLRMNPLIPDTVIDMIFGKDPKYEQQKLIEKDAKTAQGKLEDSGAIETHWGGKDEIKDWSAVEKYKPAVLKEFIDSGDYSDTDNKKLQAIIDKKAKEKEPSQPAANNTQNRGMAQKTNPNKPVAEELGLSQFSEGGWTGEGKKDEIAGVVHKKEFVLSESMLKELGAKKSANDTDKPKASAQGTRSTNDGSKEYTLDKELIKEIINTRDEALKNSLIEKEAEGKGIGAKQAIIDLLNRGKPSGTVITVNGLSIRLTNAQEEMYLGMADKDDPLGEKQNKIINDIVNNDFKDPKAGKIKVKPFKKEKTYSKTINMATNYTKDTNIIKNNKSQSTIKTLSDDNYDDMPPNDIGKQDKIPGKANKRGRKKGSKNKGVSAGKFKKPNRDVDRVFMHCSDSDYPQHDNVETIREWHIARGWSDIGYHYMIHKDGSVSKGRPIEKIPAAQGGNNTGTIAIVLHGKQEKLFNSAQLKGLKKLCTDIDKAYDHDITFHGHREVSSKSCPNFDYISTLKLNNGKLGLNPKEDTSEPNDIDGTDSTPGKAISKGLDASGLGFSNNSQGTKDMLGTQGKTRDIKNIMNGISGNITGDMNSVFGMLGIKDGISIDKDGSFNIKGNSDEIDELSPEERKERAKNKVTDALGSIGMGGKNITANILPSGLSKRIRSMSGITGMASDGLTEAKNLGSKVIGGIGASLSSMKGLFGNINKGSMLPISEKSEASIIETDGTANIIKNIAKAANITESSKNKDVIVQNKREKNIGIDDKTRTMAAKTTDKRQEVRASEKGNTTIIQQAAPKIQPQLTLSNTKFNDEMLSLVGGII